MATRAVFVGVNEHQDPAIPELSGARRDATALWALFTDTIDGLSAHLLVDERATHAEVSGAVLGTLDSAQDDDVVIVGFAGHCSPDGSLVLFDTDASDLARTAFAWLPWPRPSSGPKLGELTLTTGERDVIQQALERLVCERAGGNGSAKLTNPINIGVGTKR